MGGGEEGGGEERVECVGGHERVLSTISPQSSIDQMMVSAIIRRSSVRYLTALTPGHGAAILETLRP